MEPRRTVARGWVAAVATVAAVAATMTGAPPAAADPKPSAAPKPPPAVTAAPDEPTALAAAAQSGKRVEVLAKRTETTQVFANPNGRLTLEQYARPVRVKRNGTWIKVDTTLRTNADGSVSPAATSAGIRFSGGGTGPLATVRSGGKELGLSWPQPLPTPVLDGDTATYAEVLPGVDLKVTADVVGFSQVLVVKNRQAAANPALRRITFGTTTKGVRVKVGPGGTTTAVDSRGKTVFASGTPMMWDSPKPRSAAAAVRRALPQSGEPGPATRKAMRLQVRPGALTVIPDAGMLTDPKIAFPLVIDPSYSTGVVHWLHLNEFAPNQRGWGWDQGSGAKVGYSNWTSPAVRYRSFFAFPMWALHGAQINRAWFSIVLNHSASCGATPVQLWLTGAVNPDTTWGNTGPGHWYRHLDTRSGNANEGGGCGQNQPDMGMEFGGGVQGAVQEGANARWSDITFGLKAANDGDRMQWKKFHQSTARLNVEYNNAPHGLTNFTTVRPVRCGSPAQPVSFTTNRPQFSAIAADPNGDNVYGQLEILEGDAVIHTLNSGTVPTNTAFAWPAIADGVLPVNQPNRVFNYRARARDWQLGGAETGRCYFTVDVQKPNPPTITSTDFPDGEPATPVGTPGTVTFAKAGSDSDVAEFVFGFQQDKTTMRVAADANGTAKVPITLWRDQRTGQPTRPLYVKAVDRAGNVSDLAPTWSLSAEDRAVTAPPVRNDANGDRRSDVVAVLDQGFGRTAVWNFLAKQDGFYLPPTIAWDTDINGGFPVNRIRSVGGDFDGDGRTDIAALREDPDRKLRLYVLRSDGNRYDAVGDPAWIGGDWTLSGTRLLAGDVTGDGKDDIVQVVDAGNASYRVWVFPAASSGNAIRFDGPADWSNCQGCGDWAKFKSVLADVNGDQKADLVQFQDVGNAHTKLWVHHSTGTGLSVGQAQWDSGPGNWEWNRGTLAPGDFNGDGKDDIVAMYDYGGAQTRLWAFISTGGAWTIGAWWLGAAGTFDAGRATLHTGDFNADGKEDAAAVYDLGGGNKTLYTFASSGTGFGDKQQEWTGHVGAVSAATLWIDPDKKFRLHPKHSNKCVDIREAGTGDGAVVQQWTCLPDQPNQQFRLVQIGGTGRYEIRPVHVTGKCLDVNHWGQGDGEPIWQWTCGNGGPPQPNQQFTIDYVGGVGNDILVRPRAGHSGKCLGIGGARQDDGAEMIQWGCGDGNIADHQWYLRQL